MSAVLISEAILHQMRCGENIQNVKGVWKILRHHANMSYLPFTWPKFEPSMITQCKANDL